MRPPALLLLLAVLASMTGQCRAGESAKRLFDDLMVHYNKLRRPAHSATQSVTVSVALKLSQIIDVHEKNQIMTSIVWLKQVWSDSKLTWRPSKYDNISVLYIPAEMIWTPDIVLYNNAESGFNITICTKATIEHNGLVTWEPPAIFTSICMIDVKWFPFDIQDCHMRFGSWSFGESQLNLVHLVEPPNKAENRMVYFDDFKGAVNVSHLERGIDLSDYYPSGEWDILEIPASRRTKGYKGYQADPNARTSFIDIVYTVKLRRKPLFYTVNLVFPCVFISFCTVLVFYLPSNCGEKIGLSISILVSLTVFYLLLIDIVPATSVVLPLIGKYLLFTMIMVTASVFITVVGLNLHFRKPNTHRMPAWVKRLFLKQLPYYLLMRRPVQEDDASFRRVSSRTRQQQMYHSPGTYDQSFDGKYALNYHTTQHADAALDRQQKIGQSHLQVHKPNSRQRSPAPENSKTERRRLIAQLYYSPPVLKAFENVCFIAELLKKKDRDDKIDEDWNFVSMVFDRLFLWVFSVVCTLGTMIILLGAPALTNTQLPADQLYNPADEASYYARLKREIPAELQLYLPD